MPSNKRFIAPGFLNRIDEWLLLNKPEIWSARAHLVLYYGGGFILFLAFLAYIFPDDPRTTSGVFNWILFTTIITLIAFVIWLLYLLRFNVFKRYGISGSANRLKTFLLYLFSTAIIMLIPFVQSGMESAKANRMFSDNEVVNDLNNMNMKIVQLEYDSIEHEWRRDTFRIVDTIPGRRYNPQLSPGEDMTSMDTAISVIIPWYQTGVRLMDTLTLGSRLRGGDSAIVLNDSTYIFLECPTYIFVNSYGLETFASEKRYESRDIYRKIVQHFKRPDSRKVQSELDMLISKYANPDYYYNYSEERSDHQYLVHKKYMINQVESGFRNIIERKNMWRGHSLKVIIRLFFYLTLSFALLVFIFRHTTVKVFFLTVLSACVIAILTALFIALSGSRLSTFFFILIFYFVVFAAMSILAWKNSIRSVATGIAINFFVFMLAFVPLITVSFAYAVYAESRRYNSLESDNRHTWYLLAEIAGPVLLVIAIATVVHRLYRRWFALPEE